MTPWPEGQPIPEVCTVDEVLRILRLSRRSLARHLRAHTLPLVELERFGRIRRFRGDSVKALLRGPWAGKGRRSA